MALSHEDKKDVQKHMGKALANKVSKVTRDKNYKHDYQANPFHPQKGQPYRPMNKIGYKKDVIK